MQDVCKQCGEKIMEHTKFCTNCGYKIELEDIGAEDLEELALAKKLITVDLVNTINNEIVPLLEKAVDKGSIEGKLWLRIMYAYQGLEALHLVPRDSLDNDLIVKGDSISRSDYSLMDKSAMATFEKFCDMDVDLNDYFNSIGFNVRREESNIKPKVNRNTKKVIVEDKLDKATLDLLDKGLNYD